MFLHHFICLIVGDFDTHSVYSYFDVLCAIGYLLIDSNLVRLDGAAALGSVLDPENPFSALTQVFSVLGSVFLKVKKS